MNDDKNIVAQWRVLKKYGLIATKNNPSIKNLTPSIKRKIKKEFKKINGIGHYERGVVYRPFEKHTETNKKGIKNVKYKLSKSFVFKKTKYKNKIQPNPRTIKTKNGAIIEKSEHEKVWIDKEGRTKVSANGIIWTSEQFSGEDILKFYDDVKSNKIKLNEKKMVTWQPFGRYTTRSVSDNELFIETIDQYATEMKQGRFEDWLSSTYMHFGKMSRSK